ncbi:putative somatostatin receptor type 2-like, partial [Triplophysa rosa]
NTNVSGCDALPYVENSSNSLIPPNYLIACSLSVNMILGLPANCYVLWLSVNEMIRGQSTEIFVFNATLVEVLFCTSYVFLIQEYFFQCADCGMKTIFIGMILWSGRPMFQTCICVERYFGVLHPLTFLKLKGMKYRIACSAVGWTAIVISCVLSIVFIVHLYDFILVGFLVFFGVKLYTCMMVLKALVRPGPGDNVKDRDRVNQDKIKAFRIILMVIASSMLTYGPAIITLILRYIVADETFLLGWSVCLCFAVMSGFVQPFLYLKRVGKLPFC